MRTVLATLCLNEMEWLSALYEQHKDWPGLAKWVFVESADIIYASVSPDRVTKTGLSVDGTTEFLERLAKTDPRVVHIKHGFCSSRRREHAKCQARQRYLDVCETLYPRADLVVVLDADEFYCREDQGLVGGVVETFPNHQAYLFPQRHVWYPPSLRTSGQQFAESEVIGGYWSIPHYRVWRFYPGCGFQYRQNHNWIEDQGGKFLTRRPFRADHPSQKTGKRAGRMGVEIPQCVHMGFASSAQSRSAKHKYYVARGEGVTDTRQMYVDCRAAYESWEPGDELPHGARVIPYTGPVPEVFREHQHNEHRSTRTDELLPTPQHAARSPSVDGTDPQTRQNRSG